MKHLDLGHDDSMFVITSAGDNALHYAIAAKPRRVSSVISYSGRRILMRLYKIHCVDVNPWYVVYLEQAPTY